MVDKVPLVCRLSHMGQTRRCSQIEREKTTQNLTNKEKDSNIAKNAWLNNVPNNFNAPCLIEKLEQNSENSGILQK